MRMISTADRAAVDALVTRDAAKNDDVTTQARTIVQDVRTRGDAALIEWTEKFDRPVTGRPAARASIAPIGRDDMRHGWKETPVAVRQALKMAASNLTKVAAKQVPRPFTLRLGPGHRIEQRVQP